MARVAGDQSGLCRAQGQTAQQHAEHAAQLEHDGEQNEPDHPASSKCGASRRIAGFSRMRMHSAVART